MKRFAVIALGLAAAIALADDSVTATQLQALTPIDSVPTRSQIDYAFGGNSANALSTLADVAVDSTEDAGLRLRAVHALAKYCGSTTTPCAATDLAHQKLTELIGSTSSQTSGTPVLLLRAAVETLGPMRVSSDISILLPLLDHASRDIRASTARALQDLCNTQAINPLRVRYAVEQDLGPAGSEQVKLAISEALRILAQCSGSQ